MIDKEYGKFTASCDICGEALPPENTFLEAVKAARRTGWKGQKIDGEHENICTICRKLSRG